MALSYGVGGGLIFVSAYILSKKGIELKQYLSERMIKDCSMDVPRSLHDKRRQETYPSPTLILNGWYHLVDSGKSFRYLLSLDLLSNPMIRLLSSFLFDH